MSHVAGLGVKAAVIRAVIITVVLLLTWLLPGVVQAGREEADPSSGVTLDEITKDYQAVRKIGLALASLAFLVAVSRLGVSEFPYERARARDLLVKSLVVFVVLAGDRMVARGVVQWFGFSTSVLPVFWQ